MAALVFLILGACLVVAGVSCWSVPAGLIVAGVLVALFGWDLTR